MPDAPHQTEMIAAHGEPLDSSQRFAFLLYVTGTTARSVRAISNIRKICDEYLIGNHDLEIIDIYQQPEAARDHQIVAVPTLVKVSPGAIRRIIGDLSDTPRTLDILGIQALRMTEKTVAP